ncbi:hypothetical protein GCM10011579_016690 [Streptomyces albiflavescens]|uniref:Proline dehydrogenase n=1 Tax=Streptomyces albiflavescens TaxID=1623582 RepID=A0A917XXS0_9ACTN|nr:hypothetical protein GCM10011579_016690 [Streptomyces albiflavescens]
MFPAPDNAPVDSTTLLGLAGISGTLLGAVVGAAGTLGSARITSRAQTNTEEQKARRQAYSACATALLARRDAADALLDMFKGDDFDQAAVQARLQEVDEQRDAVARAVGAVAIEGPYDIANSAEFAAKAIELLSGRIRDWTAEVAGGRDRDELLQSQLQFALRDQGDMERMLDNFTAGCRKILRPTERDRPTRRGLLRRR